jgi:hypothetical protein
MTTMDKTTGIISLHTISSTQSVFEQGSSIMPEECKLSSTHGAHDQGPGWKANNNWMSTGNTEKVVVDLDLNTVFASRFLILKLSHMSLSLWYLL